MRRMLGVGAALAVLMLCGTAQAEQVTQRQTKTTFEVQRNINGQPHVLIGTGARRAAGMINVYGAGMYVGIKQAVPAWQAYLAGRFLKARLVENGNPNFEALSTHRQARHFVVYGRFPRAIEMAFVRDVRADQIQGAYEESWERVGLDRAAAGDALTQFMAAVNAPVSSGQRMMISTVGNTINVTMPSGTQRIAGNGTMVTAIWKIWFGDPCLQRPLRDGMLSELRRLHELAGS